MASDWEIEKMLTKKGFNAEKANQDPRRTHKFYCGALRLMPGWAKKTQAEAVKQAQELLDKQPQTNEIYIVKVVAVVSRRKAPVRVEKI